MPLRLLFITQKLHGQDAFGVLWANAFAAQGYDVTVLCLEWQQEEMQKVLPEGVVPQFRVLSMEKERGRGKLGQLVRFWKHITATQYDRVFIHMSPVWYSFGFWWWLLRGTPVYMWYTHYTMQLGVRLFGLFGKRFFCATAQSLPQYAGSPKKIVTGHGIDLTLWPQRSNHAESSRWLLIVHRLSRSKRVELCIRSLLHLPPDYTIDIYGVEAEPDYVGELRALVNELQLQSRVTFHGTVSAKDLPAIYANHRLILNMASETIDKTMLEALTCACYPVTTQANAAAVGIPRAPADDPPEAIAEFIRSAEKQLPLGSEEMYEVVVERHSLRKLIERMDQFIRPGL